MVRRKGKQGRLGDQIDALLDDAGISLKEAARRVTRSGIPFPYRSLQDWKVRDKLPPGKLAAARWERLVAVCKPPGEEEEGMQGPRHFPWLEEKAPHYDTNSEQNFLERIEAIEGMARAMLDAMVVLRHDIKTSMKKRRRNTG